MRAEGRKSGRGWRRRGKEGTAGGWGGWKGERLEGGGKEGGGKGE